MIAFVVLSIYETVIATLAFTHMVPPDDLTCLLERNWSQLYSNKDEGAIKRIQEAHQCCGLNTVKTKAWPFPDKNHKSDACIKLFNRQRSCLGDWRQDEQIYAGLLLFVALMTFTMKVRHPFLRGLDCRGAIRCSSVVLIHVQIANYRVTAALPLPLHPKTKLVGPSYGSERIPSSHRWH